MTSKNKNIQKNSTSDWKLNIYDFNNWKIVFSSLFNPQNIHTKKNKTKTVRLKEWTVKWRKRENVFAVSTLTFPYFTQKKKHIQLTVKPKLNVDLYKKSVMKKNGKKCAGGGKWNWRNQFLEILPSGCVRVLELLTETTSVNEN